VRSCAERLDVMDGPRAELTMQLLEAVFDETSHYLNRDDVIQLAQE
jgi:hypothetical protein